MKIGKKWSWMHLFLCNKPAFSVMLHACKGNHWRVSSPWWWDAYTSVTKLKDVATGVLLSSPAPYMVMSLCQVGNICLQHSMGMATFHHCQIYYGERKGDSNQDIELDWNIYLHASPINKDWSVLPQILIVMKLNIEMRQSLWQKGVTTQILQRTECC